MFEKNVKVIADNEYNWIGEYKDSNISYIEKEKLFLNKETKKFINFEDKIDEDFKINFKQNQFIIFFGVVCLDELKFILDNKNSKTKVIIIEPETTFLSYALSFYNLDYLEKENVYLFSDYKDNLLPFFNNILMTLEALSLVRNIEFYFNGYYRRYDFNIVKDYIKEINNIISTRIQSLGNSVNDCIVGLDNNLRNMDTLQNSLDVSKLKGTYKNKTAILVSAGPSLNKNIDELKKSKGKALIFAVDTIATRLIQEGIVPDFICSIERGIETYNYFYKNKKYPEQVSLVGPLVLDPYVFKEFKGNIVIPFRQNVAEYYWLEHITGITDNYVELGVSCAHVGFGMAKYLGCSPIILVGQDLAYGENELHTHAGGTIYDDKDDLLEKNQKRHLETSMWLEGYNNKPVRTNNVWMQFKTAFEQIISNDNLFVINATEGGVRINHTHQMTLNQAVEQHCNVSVNSFYEFSKTVGKYNISKERLLENIEVELNFLDKLKNVCLKYIVNLEKTDIRVLKSESKYKVIENRLNESDALFESITAHPLLRHNLQFLILNSNWQLNTLENNLETDTLEKKIGVKQKLLWGIVASISEIIDVINRNLELDAE